MFKTPCHRPQHFLGCNKELLMFPRGIEDAVIKACQKGNTINPISTKYYQF